LRTKVGEAPFYSQVDLEYNKSVLQNFAENSGYFNTRTSADSTRMVKKTAEYIVKPGKQYKIKEVKFHRFLYNQLRLQYQKKKSAKKKKVIVLLLLKKKEFVLTPD
jgi:outer membrane protein assembly factor BamA